jgi:hypothetical protein
MRKFALYAATLGMAAHAVAETTAPVTPTNDASVTYQWTAEKSWRPMCSVHLTDEVSSHKRVSISYRNLNGARIGLTVRMNPGDPQDRLISGCVAVEQILVARN